MADLLPVVSNPHAPISERSKMKAVGKVPSRYYNGLVGGIAEWPKFRPTLKKIERWAKEPDYGICIQTRYVRALDIDIDTEQAVAVEQAIWEELRIVLPQRFRPNSNKILMIFKTPGEIRKERLVTANGVIERLGTWATIRGRGDAPERGAL